MKVCLLLPVLFKNAVSISKSSYHDKDNETTYINDFHLNDYPGETHQTVATKTTGKLFPAATKHGICPAGHYCSGLSSTDARPCGAVNLFCPEGSHSPTLVKDGHYTTGVGNVEVVAPSETRSGEKLCGPDYGLTSGNCSGPCKEGYYCPLSGTTIATAMICGDPSQFCPEGSSTTIPVQIGYYSVGGKDRNTRTSEIIAPKGYYSVGGELFPCPAGRYGDTEGLSDPSCSGVCAAGWFCPPASVSPNQNACGGEDRICPEGSSSPIFVLGGFYTSKIEDECRPGTWRNETATNDPSVGVFGLPSAIPTSKRIAPCVLCGEG
eukprot:2168724-Ditylum_brightwellii.AAC.1